MSSIRVIDPNDLAAANAVIGSAVMAWPMADRVKRLALPLLMYDPVDTEHLQLLGYYDAQGCRAIAAWEPALGSIGPSGEAGVALHGLYVHPTSQRRGIGRLLQEAVCAEADRIGASGVLVKAERVSISYFERCGYERLPGAAYPNTFWRSLDSEGTVAMAPHRRLPSRLFVSI